MINGNRIKQAREMRGMTQKALAEGVGVKQPAIAQMEKGTTFPSPGILQKIAEMTGFPEAFFKQPDAPEFTKGSMLFRAKASLTQKERDAAEQYAKVVFELGERLESNFNKVPLNLIEAQSNPGNAASNLRSLWDISPKEPISNLVSLLEKNGIMVVILPVSYEKQDAFSAWVSGVCRRPIIVISNHRVSGDRLRFNMAHELGHLILHQELNMPKAKSDREANLFASEFLLPKEAILNELKSPVTVASLLSLKKRWLVSIQALIWRAHNLKIITDRQYQYLMSQWHRKTEPITVIAEKPRMLSQMAENIYGSPIDHKKIALQMNLPTEIVKDTLDRYVLKTWDNRNMEMGKIVEFIAKTKTENV